MGYEIKNEQIVQIDNTQLSQEIQSNSNKIGDLSTLTTGDKSSLVKAINENAAQLADIVTVNIRQLGAKCDGVTDDSQAIINALANYDRVYVPAVSVCKQSIVVPAGKALFGNGLTSKLLFLTPCDGVTISRNCKFYDIAIDTQSIDMNGFSAFTIKGWNSSDPLTEKLYVNNIQIFGNYPMEHGNGMKLTTSNATDAFSTIQWAEAHNITIYGYDIGILLYADYVSGDTSYINANTFDNISIIFCAEPIKIIANCTEADITSGNCQIASNYFKNIKIQHGSGSNPAVYVDGGTENIFDVLVFDWGTDFYYTFTAKSKNNEVVRKATSITQANDTQGQNFVRSKLDVKAWGVIDGTTGNLVDGFNVASVSKTGTGQYAVTFLNPMESTPYPISVTGNTLTVGYDVIIHPDNAIISNSFGIQCHHTAGGYVDISYISFTVFGK